MKLTDSIDVEQMKLTDDPEMSPEPIGYRHRLNIHFNVDLSKEIQRVDQHLLNDDYDDDDADFDKVNVIFFLPRNKVSLFFE